MEHRTVSDRIRSLPLLLLLALGAILTALTLMQPQWLGCFEWLTLIPIFLAVYRMSEDGQLSLKRAYFYGFITVYLYCFLLYHWVVRMYPMNFLGITPGASIAIIAVAWLGLPFLQAFFGGWMFWLWKKISATDAVSRFPWLRPVVFSALWTVFEWTTTLGWIGVPWGRLALGQTACLPMLQSASLLGSYFVSFLILLVNGLLAYSIYFMTHRMLCRVGALLLAVTNLLFGALRMYLPKTSAQETVKVAVIQGNVDITERWSSSGWWNFREVYRELTAKAASEGAELVIWPESTFPYEINKDPSSLRFLSNLATANHVAMIVGALYEDEEGGLYNALYYVDPEGRVHEEVYFKRHLVPFGEYVPMRWLFEIIFPPLTQMTTFADLTEGDAPSLFETPWGTVGSLLCFDSIYEQLTLESVREGAEILIVASNDSWFYDSVGVTMHQMQAQLRAIESGREIARAACTGISSMIGSYGEVRASLGALTEGYLVSELQMNDTPTLYSILGNLWVWLCMLFLAFLLLHGRIQRICRFKGKRQSHGAV